MYSVGRITQCDCKIVVFFLMLRSLEVTGNLRNLLSEVSILIQAFPGAAYSFCLPELFSFFLMLYLRCTCEMEF